ncbi:MAG: hypothetical protein HUU34_08165 [Saprospiraceae bacterium]|jgi:hypothetical protein|nr:hypothetical protein [Saprospiraceae bacterium]
MKKVVEKWIEVKKFVFSLDGDMDRFMTLFLPEKDEMFKRVEIFFQYDEKPIVPEYRYVPRMKMLKLRLPAQNFRSYLDMLKTEKPCFINFKYDMMMPEKMPFILSFRLSNAGEPIFFEEVVEEVEKVVL